MTRAFNNDLQCSEACLAFKQEYHLTCICKCKVLVIFKGKSQMIGPHYSRAKIYQIKERMLWNMSWHGKQLSIRKMIKETDPVVITRSKTHRKYFVPYISIGFQVAAEESGSEFSERLREPLRNKRQDTACNYKEESVVHFSEHSQWHIFIKNK